MVVRARSIVSAGLSGFFAPYIDADPRRTGAIGGGLGIADAISADVAVRLGGSNDVIISNKINGSEVDSCLARYIVKKMFELAGVRGGEIYIEQRISVPIGGGYGTSGGSAVAIAFATAKALRIDIDREFNTVAEIAHEADIICKSGLGTVVGVINQCEGIVLVSKPGGPGVAEVSCIGMDHNLVALTAFYNPISKNSILANVKDLERIKILGLETLRRIEFDPTPENFMANCRRFALETGFVTKRIEQIIDLLIRIEGILGVSMNMIGEAIFAILDRNSLSKALEVVNRTHPKWVYIWRPSVKSIMIEDMV